MTVRGVDDPDTAEESVTVSLSATDGGYGGQTASVTVSVMDDDTANLVVSPSTLSVGEAGSGDFTVKLATQPSAGVSVSVSSGDTGAATVSPASLSFTTANWDTTQTVTVSGVDDPDTAEESVTVSLSATDGGYEWPDGVGERQRHGRRHGEPGGQRIHAERGGGGQRRLHGEAGDAAQRRRKRVGVLGRHGSGDGVSRKPELHDGQLGHDADGDGQRGGRPGTAEESVTVSLSATDGGYEGKMSSVIVSVMDDDTANLVVSESMLSVGEAGSGDFTVKLATQPSAGVSVSVSSDDTGAATVSPASLSFTTANWDTTQTVTVSGVDDPDTAEESVTVSLSATDGGYGGQTASVSVSVMDDDTANLVVSPSMLSVGEAGSGDFTVKLATQPSAGVSVSVSSGDTGAATVSPASLSFTTANWGTEQTVTVSGVDDPDTAEESVTVSLSATGGGYVGKIASVMVTITDNDTASLVVSASMLSVGEAGSGDFTVKLATQPSAGVNVSVSSGDTAAATVSPASLSFTTANWNTAQTVTVSGVDDPDTADESVTVSLSATDGGYGGQTASVSVSVMDDDTANLVVSPSTLSVGEAGSGDFTVKLATQPSAGVSVSVLLGRHGSGDGVSRKPELHDGQLGHDADGDGQRGGRPGHR